MLENVLKGRIANILITLPKVDNKVGIWRAINHSVTTWGYFVNGILEKTIEIKPIYTIDKKKIDIVLPIMDFKIGMSYYDYTLADCEYIQEISK